MSNYYRQITWQALEESGLTPGDAHQFYQEVISKNSAMTAGGEAKVGWSIKDQTRETSVDAHEKMKKENEERFEEKKEQDEKAAKERPAQDQENARIMGMPMQMTGALFGLGLGAEAVERTGALMSPGLNQIGDQMMVTSSDGKGTMLDAARQALGVGNPAHQDMMVTAPDQTASFTPGQAPQMDAPEQGMNASIGPRNPSMAAIPGLSGPSFGPGRG